MASKNDTITDLELRQGCDEHAKRTGWLDEPTYYSVPVHQRPDSSSPRGYQRCYTAEGLVSAAKHAQGDKVYCYRVMQPFMGLPEGAFVIADFNAIDLQAIVVADRDDPESIIGVWREASVPLFGIAQDLGLLQWWSCSELAWSLSQRRGSLQCSLELVEGAG